MLNKLLSMSYAMTSSSSIIKMDFIVMITLIQNKTYKLIYLNVDEKRRVRLYKKTKTVFDTK